MSSSPVLDIVKGFFPSATDRQAESILWTCTGWPGFFVVPEGKTKWDVLKEQLEEIAVKSGGVVERALVIADEEMDAAMEHGRRRERERKRGEQ